MASNWSRILTARDMPCGIRPSSRYKKTPAEFYHPNFVARLFRLAQHIPMPFNSVVGALRRLNLKGEELLTINHNKLLDFTWHYFYKTPWRNQFLCKLVHAVKDLLFPRSINDCAGQFMGMDKDEVVVPTTKSPLRGTFRRNSLLQLKRP